jgi:hypothetical protein
MCTCPGCVGSCTSQLHASGRTSLHLAMRAKPFKTYIVLHRSWTFCRPCPPTTYVCRKSPSSCCSLGDSNPGSRWACTSLWAAPNGSTVALSAVRTPPKLCPCDGLSPQPERLPLCSWGCPLKPKVGARRCSFPVHPLAVDNSHHVAGKDMCVGFFVFLLFDSK